MRYNIVIHPDRLGLRPFVEGVKQQTVGEGRIIYQSYHRNTIAVFNYEGTELNVKRYKIPILLNQIVYSLWRKSKARRAYEYAVRLTEQGVETASPVAYIESFRAGLLKTSYLITDQCPYTRNMYEFGQGTEEGREDILRAFGRFTARMHQAGAYHADYSPGNILFDKVQGEWRFCVVDINRMQFGRVSFDKGCRNFERLWGTQAMFSLMAEGYAEAMQYDFTACNERILHFRKVFWTKRNRTHKDEAQPI